MYRRTAASILNTTTDVVTKKHPMRQASARPCQNSRSASAAGAGLRPHGEELLNVKLDPLFEPGMGGADEERREKAAKRYESV
jgi:DNA polymerase